MLASAQGTRLILVGWCDLCSFQNVQNFGRSYRRTAIQYCWLDWLSSIHGSTKIQRNIRSRVCHHGGQKLTTDPNLRAPDVVRVSVRVAPPPLHPPPIFRASKSARQLMRLRSYTTANRVNSGHLNIQSSEFRSTEYTRSHRARPFSTTSYQYPSLRLLLQHGSAPQPAAPCKTASI